MVHSFNTLTNLKKYLFNVLLLCAVALSAIPKPAYAQISDFKITASDGAASDQFGWSVSISGDYAVVGAWQDADNGIQSGSAYIFKRTGTSWAQEAKLLPSDGAAQDLFGWSVSISGDYAVVGAWLDGGSGSAYIFKRTGTTWAQEAKLLASDGAASDAFGASVFISGDYAVVGANSNDDNGSNSGSAYIFKRTGTSWAQEAKLLASDGAAGDVFGTSVSIFGDYAVVGANRDDDNGDASGSAYVFKRAGTTWAQEAKLLPSDGAIFDQFGNSVSISGDYAVVGAELDDDNGENSGSAYVFKRTGTSWAQEAQLLASDGAIIDQFGGSVSISGDYAVVGATNDDNDNGVGSGSAYLFNLHDPFVVNPIQDVALDEDFGTVIAVVLDTVFNDLDLPDNDSLRFSVVISDSILTHSFSGDTLFLHSVGDSNGVAQVIVTATDDSAAAVSDTSNISITLVNDAPMFVDFPDTVNLEFGMSDTLILSDYTFDADDPDSLLEWEQWVCVGAVDFLCVEVRSDTAFIYPVGDYSGVSNFEFVVFDTSAASDTVSVIIDVRALVGIVNEGLIPQAYSLSDNYPNPFNPQTTISYGLPQQSDLSLIIYNIMGQEIMRWDEQNSQAGFYQKIWNGRNKFGVPVASGVYFYRIIAGEFVKTRKMILLK